MMRGYAATDFVHHDPYFASDAESLASAMDDNAREHPNKQLEIVRTIAEGPLWDLGQEPDRDSPNKAGLF
jgi:predicted SnoaL-like aldol condensation-catalyzing enzyme